MSVIEKWYRDLGSNGLSQIVICFGFRTTPHCCSGLASGYGSGIIPGIAQGLTCATGN